MTSHRVILYKEPLITAILVFLDMTPVTIDGIDENLICEIDYQYGHSFGSQGNKADMSKYENDSRRGDVKELVDKYRFIYGKYYN